MGATFTSFIDENYVPSDKDIVMLYKVTPIRELSVKEVAGRIAAESSVGTWTTLNLLPKRYYSLMARVFEIRELSRDEWLIKIAYPIELFEEASVPNLVSSVLGNIFGMKAVKSLRAEDIYLPKQFIDSFYGPQHGIMGVRRILDVYKRPILATVPKPKVGYDPEEYAKVAYMIMSGGVDLVKDDENLASQGFCRFEKRLALVMKALEKAESETGEKKGYLVNVTAPVKEMERRIKLAADYGNKFIMVDFLIVGWSALQYVRELAEEYKLAIHGHRAFHAAFTRNKRHGVSMHILAKLGRLIGLDHMHIGTPGVGKLEAEAREVLELASLLRSNHYKPSIASFFDQKWWHIKPSLPVSSGGLHPGTLPQVLNVLGVDLILQVGGGVLGHPDGPKSGAIAVRQAIDAWLSRISLDEYAASHYELRRALEKWGKKVPL